MTRRGMATVALGLACVAFWLLVIFAVVASAASAATGPIATTNPYGKHVVATTSKPGPYRR